MTTCVRLMTPDDREIAGNIAMAAYNRPSNYAATLGRYLTLQPDGWYLALFDGEPVGLGGAIDFGPFAYLGMMSVLPSMQKRGIGLTLMEALLSWLDARGCQTVLLNARPRAISLYERCGFVTVEQTQQWWLPPLSQPQTKREGIFIGTPDALPEVAAFDGLAFGAQRFAVLESYFARDPRRFFLARSSEGAVTGFVVAGETTLGPWQAVNIDVAEVLLQQALDLPYASHPLVSLSEHNNAARELFARYGGELYATLAHMRRGQPLERDQQRRVYGMASLMLG